MKLLLLGATGLVGSRTLALALADDVISEVIAPTRRPLAPNDWLVNPVGESLERLVPNLMSYRPNAVICALGTTRAIAGSKEAFRYVDYELPVAIGKMAHAAGVARYAIVTAMGASTRSISFYYRTKGEVEETSGKSVFHPLRSASPVLSTVNEMKKGRRKAPDWRCFASWGRLSEEIPCQSCGCHCCFVDRRRYYRKSGVSLDLFRRNELNPCDPGFLRADRAALQIGN